MRKERIADIAPLFGDTTYPDDDIRKLAHFGTIPPAPVLAIEDARASDRWPQRIPHHAASAQHH